MAEESRVASVAMRGTAVTLGFQVLKFVTQFVGMAVIGRIIGPGSYGLVAMALTLVGLGEVFRDFGLSSAAIQAKHLTREQQSNLFWINSSVGFLICGACIAAAPMMALIYHDSRVGWVTAVLGVQYIFSGAQTQFQAGMARSLRFGTLAITDLLAQIAGVCAGIVVATNGGSYWSLCVALISQQIFLACMRFAVGGFVPGKPSRTAPMADLLRYGGNLAATQILVYATRNADTFLVGLKYGAGPTGLYARAYQLLLVPENQLLAPLTGVALPVLARVRESGSDFERYMRTIQVCLCYATSVIFGCAVAVAPGAVPLVFGSQWDSVVRIFQLLSIGGILQAATYICFWTFLSHAATGLHFRISLLTRAVILIGIVAGLPWGANAVAAGVSAGLAVSTPVMWFAASRVAGTNTRTVAAPAFRAWFVAGVASVVGLACDAATANFGLVARASSAGAGSLLAIAVVVVLIPACRRDVRLIVNSVNRMRGSSL